MKKTLIKILSLTLLLGLILPSNQIKANEETNDLRNSFLEAGVSEDKVDGLIEKVNNNETLDSLNPNKEPISIVTKASGDNVVTIQEYEDGSISKITVTRDFEGNAAVTGGTKTSGSYWAAWTGVKVVADYLTLDCSFYVDYEASYGSSTITRAYDYSITVRGGSYSNPSLSIIRANGNTSTGVKAEARLSFDASAASIAATTVKLKVFVTGNGVASATLTN